MSISAANSAGLPNVSPYPFVSRYVMNHYRLSFRGDANSSRSAICLDFREPSADKNLALKRVWRFVSRLMLGHRSELFRRPTALGLLLRIARPFGVPVPPKTCLQNTAKNALQTSFMPLPESRPSTLGSRAHSLASFHVTRATTDEFNKRRHTHVSEQSNAHWLPRQQPRSSHQQPRRQRHHSFVGDQVLLQKERRECLAHGMAPLHRIRQALGVRQDAHEGRTCSGRRRAAQPRIREQENELEAARLGNPGLFDPQARSRRKVRSGRSGSR